MNVKSISQSVRSHAAGFIADETGATAIEYGLIAGLVSIAIIAALTTMGGDLSALFAKISTTLSNATTAAS